MNTDTAHPVEAAIASVATRLLRTPIERDTPLDRLGLDSLATIELAAALETELGCTLPADLITEGCTARSLATRLREEGVAARTEDRFEEMFADAVLPDDIRPAGIVRGSADLAAARTILLTGATGFLGSALLTELLRSTTATVVCLVRRTPSRATHPRVRFLEGDLSHAGLGLSRPRWDALTRDVDAVLHCGATVNWVFGYASLRAANVTGTRELLRLACDAHASFHFVSSLSACYSTGAPREVSETFDALAHVRGVHLGYAQTKVVAEALVREAGTRGLPVRIYRPALISGHSTTGAYNRDDVIATLIRGCVAMGTAPDLDWQLDAQPVDTVARAIVALSGDAGPVFHLAHPRPRHWRECVLWMRMKGYDVRLVSYPAWLRQLERETHADAAHPLRPLRSFFLDRPTGAGGLTLPELYEDGRRTFASSAMTQELLSRAGIEAPALDAELLDIYFGAFVAAGDLPPKGGSYRGRQLPPEGGSYRLASEHSIIGELTAWRSKRSTGLFREGDRFRKIKALDTDVIAVGEALADVVDPAVGAAYRKWSHRLGFMKCHEREIAIYRQTDPRFVRHAQRVFETTAKDDEFSVLLESIDDGVVMDSAGRRDLWTAGHIERAIDGLAELHAIWLGRDDELRAQPWIGHVQSAASMTEMTDLWAALAHHAGPLFAAAGDADLPRVHARLVARVAEWWPALEHSPRTLIHHDFNPRNVCLRGAEATLCAYDWELATLGAPQRDLAEFLCFVLPESVAKDDVGRWIEHHRRRLEREAGTDIDPAAWQRGFASALYDLLINRLSIYAIVHRVRRQAFLPAVVSTWRQLYRVFPLEDVA